MRTITAVLGAFALFAATSAQSALQVDITQGANGALPIAIVPFGNESGGKLPVDIAKIASRDLRRTGLFKPLARNDMLAQPERPEDVNFGNWRSVNVDDLVVGSVAANGQGGYRITFQIIDVYKGQGIDGFQITTQQGQLEDAAHAVANHIYQEFVGSKGYFLSHVAYITTKQGAQGGVARYNLVVADYDGRHPKTIKSSSDPIISPAWSPDGSKIAYVAYNVKRGRTALQVQNLRTGKITTISSRPGINGAPAWSPDGTKLAMALSYRGSPDIYTYDFSAGGNLAQVTFNGAIDTQPSWSPDGKYIAFTSDRGGQAQIYRVRATGGDAERLTFSGKSNQDPEYSPDGKTMAMVQGGDHGFRIAVMDLDSNNVRIVSDGPLDESPSFAPNGQAIIYARQGGDLATVSVDGKVRTQLHQAGDLREPAWSPAFY